MTPRGTSRTQRCSSAEAKRRQNHARQFLDVAELAASDRDSPEDLEYTNAAATLAVLAGIAASDAACCHELGERSRASDHHQAEQLVERIRPGGRQAAKRLRTLIALKDDAQYGFYSVSGPELRRALRSAKALVELADEILSRGA